MEPTADKGAASSSSSGTAEGLNQARQSNPTTKTHLNAPTGWASMGSTTAFRALNFELFVKPNKIVMAFGVVAFSCCLSYIVYMNLTDDKKRNTYVTLDEDGGTTVRQKTSRWY